MPAAKGSARTPLGPKIPKIVTTFVYASSQGQRTHSARTNFRQVSCYLLEGVRQMTSLYLQTVEEDHI
jgi:hypothetical protein